MFPQCQQLFSVDVGTIAPYCQGMAKEHFIKFRVTDTEKAAFEAAAAARGKSMSEAIREYMARVVKKSKPLADTEAGAQ